MQINRRDAIVAGAAALAAAPDAEAKATWDTGALRHVLPAATHDSFLLKCSFERPLKGKVLAHAGRQSAQGVATDSERRYWAFRLQGLEPGRTYTMRLTESGRDLCDAWPLKTLPHPDDEPESFRVLAFTCAGGLEGQRGPRGVESFRSLAVRRRLLARGLSFQPDAVIANGDHVYWDQKSWLLHVNPAIRDRTTRMYDEWGRLDPAHPMSSGANEALLERVGRTQIADLYGAMLRSTPCWFLPDDHDYFENDEAEERFVTFPPDRSQTDALRTVQTLFYPEFLPQPGLPQAMSGVVEAGWGAGLSRSFGLLKAGRLAEVLLYDTIGFMSLKDRNAGLAPPEVEAWLIERTRTASSRHLVHSPSFPVGWTCGKWREWYPDVVDVPAQGAAGDVVVRTHSFNGVGSTSTDRPKYLWQSGWYQQHQRLLQAMAQSGRAAIVASGDIHAVGLTRIIRSGDLDLAGTPVHCFLVGPLGSSQSGFPSFARGVLASTPKALQAEGFESPREQNGFSVFDFDRNGVTVRQFGWNDVDGEGAIDTLAPFATTRID
jgi:hypothetical protein